VILDPFEAQIPALDIIENPPVEEVLPADDDAWAPPPKKSKKGKKGKELPSNILDPFEAQIPASDIIENPPVEEVLPADDDAWAPFPKKTNIKDDNGHPPSPTITQASLCPLQLEHISEGSWKSCDECCAMIRQLSAQLPRNAGSLDDEKS
jgi:hypothetical protein